MNPITFFKSIQLWHQERQQSKVDLARHIGNIHRATQVSELQIEQDVRDASRLTFITQLDIARHIAAMVIIDEMPYADAVTQVKHGWLTHSIKKYARMQQ